MRKKIAMEIQAGRVLDPFSVPPLPNLRVSPLGADPKKTPGEFRLINDLSYPWGIHSMTGSSLTFVQLGTLH